MKKEFLFVSAAEYPGLEQITGEERRVLGPTIYACLTLLESLRAAVYDIKNSKRRIEKNGKFTKN